MKAIGLAFQDFDFIVHAFQFGGVNRKATRVDQAILIFLSGLDKGLEIPRPCFQGEVRPILENFLRPRRACILLKPFEIVFQQVHRRQQFIAL
jgi:hypothetical protein